MSPDTARKIADEIKSATASLNKAADVIRKDVAEDERWPLLSAIGGIFADIDDKLLGHLAEKCPELRKDLFG